MFRKIYLLLFLLFITSIGYPQCSSGTGTPLINETFGSGASTVGPPLPAGTTNMLYVNNTCPNDGQYSIVNYTTGCYGAWHTLTDHTGDANGYFMLVNASYAPSDFFVQTVNGLCDGTSYEFSAWIANINRSAGAILPNITFTIEKTDGTILSANNTGDVPESTNPTWVKYAFYFKTPVGVSAVVVRMHNNAPGGGGNDLALDDIAFSPAGPQTTVGVNGSVNNTLHVLCNNKTSIVSSVGNCYVNNAYQWQTSVDGGTTWNDISGETNPNYNISLPGYGSYIYRLNVAENGNIGSPNCRVNSNAFTIIYDPPAVSNISAAICAGTTYVLPSGKSVNAQGAYIDTARNKGGCDSLITHLDLKTEPISYSALIAEICGGQTYLGHTTSGFYTDTLTAANGCDSIRILNLTVKPRAYNSINVTVCQGGNYLGRTTSGVYTDTLKARNGCDSLLTINLNVVKLNPNLGPARILCLGDSIRLSPGVFTSYLWQDNSTLPHYTLKTGGIYAVKVTDENGCTASDTVKITEINCSLANIPNTFTPNGDGINDTWDIIALEGYPGCTVFIYNRWGQLVFNSVNYSTPWDGKHNGKELPVGTYYYIINLNDNSPSVSGFVTLLR